MCLLFSFVVLRLAVLKHKEAICAKDPGEISAQGMMCHNLFLSIGSYSWGIRCSKDVKGVIIVCISHLILFLFLFLVF